MNWLVLNPPATTLQREVLAFVVDSLALAVVVVIVGTVAGLAMLSLGGALSPPSLDTSEGGRDV